ncbi:hypothetical protein BO94DRAFT_607607 [Aspergillus sclerotioniger CBS 115572]|uniref:Uncharacterized protein n=1 Tax=Aspergillus sclerotioniger CBS 115572 TaxID=1450535 RepID=A0A317VFF9_9EURO|nr:hypothetical protein BO94DRAFT_607607 [Aspergillus sclerotioniger CBS 115572]PWY73124.1 hypothetical protein BO94DRAFT_607607 [Aspergillus sclerotioniger CBS 115572]
MYNAILPGLDHPGTTYFYYHLGYTNSSECMPSGWSLNSYFSPGRCPSGYTVATTAVSITNDTRTETWADCCPTGYSYDKAWGLGERCTSTAPQLATSTSNPTQRNQGLVAANAVSVKWSAEDFSTSSTDSQSRHDSLSVTAKASIGISVTFGFFIVIVLAFTVYHLCRGQKQQPGVTYNQSATRRKRRDCCLRVVTLLVIGLSGARWGPIRGYTNQLPNRLHLAVGECIGQLRWITLRQSRKPLSYIQLYDSASRGPWGSFRILLQDEFRSLVTVGACVVILALAFDPFIQQIISYPVQPTQRYSKEAVVTQSRYIIAVFQRGLWPDPVSLDPSCPTGNCTWPHYRSVEMCNQCANVNPSRVLLAGWDFSSFNYSLHGNQAIPARISMVDGQWSDFLIEIIWRKVGFYRAYIPSNLYFLDGPNITYDSDTKFVAGISNPLAVVTHVELNLPVTWKSNDDLLRAIGVAKVTQCAFTVCAKTYNVSVTNGVASVQTLDEDMGSFYPPDYLSNLATSVCWKPNSSPMTNWTTAGQREGSYAKTDPANYEFCGLDSVRYWDSLPLSGTVSPEYELETSLNGSMIWQPLVINPYPSSASVQKVYEMGLATTMDKIGAALSKLARTYSNNSIYGVVITQDSYVAVKWPWLALPAVLLVAGTVFLIATALITSHDGASLWKSSVLPLLFHGPEPNLVTRDMVVEHGPCEVASEMEQAAGEVNVGLGVSEEGGRTMLQGERRSAEPTVGQLLRRQTF